MIGRTTSEGKVWEKDNVYPGFQALLFDFDVNSTRLKSAHTRYLDGKAKLLDSNETWNIKIEGRASRTGSGEHNLTISKLRAEAVYAYLAKVVSGAKVVRDWVGEARAERKGEKDGTENMYSRAVEVTIFPDSKPLPRPMDQEPPKVDKPTLPSVNKMFKIRLVSGSSVGGGIASVSGSKEGCQLEIWDKEDNACAAYRYEGFARSVGKGIGFVSLSAVYESGPWNTFTAPRHIALNDFGGPARFQTLSASSITGSVGRTRFSFRPLHWYSVQMGCIVKDFKGGKAVGTPGLGYTDSIGTLTYAGKGKCPH